jgi:hypothetical protein
MRERSCSRNTTQQYFMAAINEFSVAVESVIFDEWATLGE